MSGSVNKVILVGNLGRDPEVRTTNNGMRIVSFSLATSERWKDRQTGEQQDRTEWHNVVIMNERLGEVAERYLRKGSSVYVEGQLQTRKWTDQQGTDRWRTEIVLGKFRGELTLLGSRGEAVEDAPAPVEQARGGNGRGAPMPQRSRATTQAPDWNDALGDDIPF